MSQENVELVRSMYSAWARGDWTSVDWAHPEIEMVIADGPSPSSWTGLASASEGWRDFLSTWEEFRVEADEYRVLDEERVLVLARPAGHGKTSGVELEETASRGAQLFHIRSGKVMRLVHYFDRERALADLSEQDAHADS